jgi:hypothetical protein
VTLQDLKIVYRDGPTQTVTVSNHSTEDIGIIFYDDNGQVLRIRRVTCKALAGATRPTGGRLARSSPS